jgi:hypothetical protein
MCILQVFGIVLYKCLSCQVVDSGVRSSVSLLILSSSINYGGCLFKIPVKIVDFFFFGFVLFCYKHLISNIQE